MASLEAAPEASTSYAPPLPRPKPAAQQPGLRWPWQQQQQQQQQQLERQAGARVGSSGGGSEGGGSSARRRRRVTIPRGHIPLDLLVASPSPAAAAGAAAAAAAISSEESVRRANRDAAWANRREPLLAALAAGFHVALFAYNLAFWGFEGTPPDRYWPDNPRYRLHIHSGRYGNLEGTKSLYYYYLSKMEGM